MQLSTLPLLLRSSLLWQLWQRIFCVTIIPYKFLYCWKKTPHGNKIKGRMRNIHKNTFILFIHLCELPHEFVILFTFYMKIELQNFFLCNEKKLALEMVSEWVRKIEQLVRAINLLPLYFPLAVYFYYLRFMSHLWGRWKLKFTV